MGSQFLLNRHSCSPVIAPERHCTWRRKSFVDGKLTAADAYLSGNWRTVLAGTLGAGGMGLFVLDVTDRVRAWLANPASSNGFGLTATLGLNMRLQSKEDGDGATLEIVFTLLLHAGFENLFDVEGGREISF